MRELGPNHPSLFEILNRRTDIDARRRCNFSNASVQSFPIRSPQGLFAAGSLEFLQILADLKDYIDR
jgi:hypothetical protein